MKARTYKIIGVLLMLFVLVVYGWSMSYSWNQVNMSKAPDEVFYFIYAPLYTFGFGAFFVVVLASAVLAKDQEPSPLTDSGGKGK